MPSKAVMGKGIPASVGQGHQRTVQVRLHDGGLLEGVLENGNAVYRGIPYAQRPFGELRFQVPEPVPVWTGVVQAFEFAPASPQAPRDTGTLMFGGEDCLALNVWAPADAGSGCPVMVWIPGGAYMRGNAADPVYDGAAFARQGIVFVSLNYRVGVDGFMSIPGLPANRGLLDQIAGLQWVKRNIRAFGGDASRITVAGGSAGAGAIACLLGMPAARGLFSRAILQSPSLATHTVAEADMAAAAIASLLGIPLSHEAVASVPLPKVIATLKRLADDPSLRRDFGLSTRNFFPLRAVIDGHVLSSPPLTAMANSWTHQSPGFSLLVGCNKEEMRLYAVPTGVMSKTSQKELLEFARDVGVTERTLRFYAENLATGSSLTAGEVLCAMQSDYFYRISARKIAADASAAGFATYLYEFDWRSPRCDGKLGAAHGLEIPFVFNQLATAAGAEITGPGAPLALAEGMHSSWVRFVKMGSPGWPRHTSQAGNLMHFNEKSRYARDDWARPEELWQVIG
ncbi:MAG: carboxylesterase family protein [Pseudomonadota bacterium]